MMQFKAQHASNGKHRHCSSLVLLPFVLREMRFTSCAPWFTEILQNDDTKLATRGPE